MFAFQCPCSCPCHQTWAWILWARAHFIALCLPVLPLTLPLLTDVGVDVVGKYRYTMASPSRDRDLSVNLIVDIELVGRTKVGALTTLHAFGPGL